jgi:hypothetical protein
MLLDTQSARADGHPWRGMKRGQVTCVLTILIGIICSMRCAGQTPLILACAAFSADGAAATGTIKGGDLETRLTVPGISPNLLHFQVGNSNGCEEAFSKDGRWLATVVAAEKLTVFITDRVAGTSHGRFESDWNTFRKMPLEPGYRAPFLGGFADDGSLVLWRYIPQKGSNETDASTVRIHLQRWSVDGDLLSEDDLGPLGYEAGGRVPLAADALGQLWVPGGCGDRCYRGISFTPETGRLGASASLTLPKAIAATPINLPKAKSFLSVSGERTNQQAILFSYSGQIDHQVSLPFAPNLLGPLVPDWFYVHNLTVSPDEQIAAVGRSRVAWVMVDTDRDWGSEVLLLQLQPLGVLATLKTGTGGVGALAVDHRNNSVRLLGFWKERWHDLTWNAASPGKWKENTETH